MRARHSFELGVGFGKRDVEHPLPAPLALEQKLQREGRLAGTRIALHQVEAIARHAASEYSIEPLDAGATALIRNRRPLGHVALQGDGLWYPTPLIELYVVYSARRSHVGAERTCATSAEPLSPGIFATVVVVELAGVFAAEFRDQTAHGLNAFLGRQLCIGSAHIGF